MHCGKITKHHLLTTDGLWFSHALHPTQIFIAFAWEGTAQMNPTNSLKFHLFLLEWTCEESTEWIKNLKLHKKVQTVVIVSQWHDLIWHYIYVPATSDMIDRIWSFDMISFGTISQWHDCKSVTWSHLALHLRSRHQWYDLIWYDLIWCDLIWHCKSVTWL